MSFEHISFKFSIEHLLERDGLLLGEVKSKLEHVLTTPLHPEVVRELSKIYLAKGINATTAIEGNTLTEEEVAQIISKEKELLPSKKYLQDEVQNIEKLFLQANLRALEHANRFQLSIEDLCSYQKQILQNLPLESGIKLGALRNTVVRVGPYKCPDWQDCPELLEKFLHFYNHELTDRLKVIKIPFIEAVIKAIIAHLYIVWIHPFGDGNGRTARFVESQTLMMSGIPFISCQLLSNFYNKTRQEYVRHLTITWQRPDDGLYYFIHYALQGLLDELKEQILSIQGHVWDIVLENTIHKEFEGHKSEADKRKRDLALFFFNNKGFSFTLDDLLDQPFIHRLYLNKTPRTLQADLKYLTDSSLLIDANYFIGKKSKQTLYTINRFLVLRQLPDHKYQSENQILRKYFPTLLPKPASSKSTSKF